MIAHSIEMYEYMDTSSGKPVILKNAPEHIKEEARMLNQAIEKRSGEKNHYIIEE